MEKNLRKMFTHLKIKTASEERERAVKEKKEKKTTQTNSRMMTSIEKGIYVYGATNKNFHILYMSLC